VERKFLNIKQCAEYLNVSVHYLYKSAARKEIPHTRIGRKILFSVSRLDNWIDERSFEPIDDWSEKILR